MNYLAKTIHDYNVAMNAILNQADQVLVRITEDQRDSQDNSSDPVPYVDPQAIGPNVFTQDRAMWSMGFAASLFFRTLKSLPDPTITAMDVDDIDNLPEAEPVDESALPQRNEPTEISISFDRLCEICLSLPEQMRTRLLQAVQESL